MRKKEELIDKIETVIAYVMAYALYAAAVGGMIWMFLIWMLNIIEFQIKMQMLAG